MPCGLDPRGILVTIIRPLDSDSIIRSGRHVFRHLVNQIIRHVFRHLVNQIMRLSAEEVELIGDVLFTVIGSIYRWEGRSLCGQCLNKWDRHLWVSGGDVTSLEVYCLGGLLCTGPRNMS